MADYDFPLVPFLFATALAVNGLRKRSLSPSGAAAAFLTGIAMLSLPLRTPGIALIVFYLLGSRATRAGRTKKAALEDGHDAAGGGYRSAAQVFANSASALGATLLWGALFAPGFPGARTAAVVLDLDARPPVYRHDAWCPLDRAVSAGWSRALIFVVLGHFACCLGDTLASELGILSTSPPLLLTTLTRVPPGTNGALSLTGTVASVVGGALMGVAIWATLVVENAVCRQQVGVGVLFVVLVGWGAVAGGAGSLLDSLLGATLQQTQYSETRKRILTDTSVPLPSGERKNGTENGKGAAKAAVEERVTVVSGIDVLTNNQVNLISSTLTALALAYIA